MGESETITGYIKKEKPLKHAGVNWFLNVQRLLLGFLAKRDPGNYLLPPAAEAYFLHVAVL